MTKSHEEAEDVVQDAFHRAYMALPRFRGDSRMDTWLHAIVRNVALVHLRSRKGRIEIPLEPFGMEGDDISAHQYADPAESPEEYYGRTEREKMLRCSMNDMSSACRVALQKCVLEELPYREVASELNVSLGTLKSRVFHGKRMLKRAAYRRMGLGDDTALPLPIANFEEVENAIQ